jgi:RNA polymerase sigma factor (sigma-70 family)
VRGIENPGGYLVRTAINRAKSHLRKQGRVRVVDIHEVQPAADGPTPEQKFFLDSDNALLEEELLKMGERERNVLLMKDVDRYSFSDVAGYLNMKVPTVKSLYRRAKLKLAKKLGKSR